MMIKMFISEAGIFVYKGEKYPLKSSYLAQSKALGEESSNHPDVQALFKRILEDAKL